MINKTVGTGGDYANNRLAYQSLGGPFAILADNYTFTQISDFTEHASGIPDETWPNFGGFTVTFTNPYGFSISTAAPYCCRPNGNLGSLANIIWDGLIINITSPLPYLFYTAPWSASTINAYYKNMKINGKKKTNPLNPSTHCISTRGGDNYLTTNILNCIIYNFDYGIDFAITSHPTSPRCDYIENCSVYYCDKGVFADSGYNANDSHTFKNVVIFGSITKDWDTGSEQVRLINCADSDGSIAASGAYTTKTNCLSGITSVDFKSVNILSSDFLKLNQFVVLSTLPTSYIGSSISPSLSILCTSKLWKTGTASISAWNTEDLLDNQRPNNDGSVCIGAYEKWEIVSYFWNLDDGNCSSSASPIVTYIEPGAKSISVTIVFSDGSTQTISGTLNVYGYNLDFSGDNLSGIAPLETKFSVSFEP